jgi:hypothetical protein
MTRIAPVLALALAAACAPQTAQQAASPAASPNDAVARDVRPSVPMPRGMAPDSGVRAILQTGRDVFTERYTRTSERVESVLTAPGLHAMVNLQLGPNATVRRLEVRQFSASNAPQGTVTAEFRGDSVFGEATSPNSAPQVIRQAVPAGSIPFVNPSPVLMEQIVRRARAIGGSPVQVPIWLVAGGGQSAMSTVTFVEGGATFTLGPVEVSVTLDEQGRINGGNIPQQGLTLARREATAVPVDSAAAHHHH